jgi:hypothetical protein
VAVEGLDHFGKVPGEWYGVGSITQVVEALNSKFKPIDDFEVCVFNEGIVIGDMIMQKVTTASEL